LLGKPDVFFKRNTQLLYYSVKIFLCFSSDRLAAKAFNPFFGEAWHSLDGIGPGIKIL